MTYSQAKKATNARMRLKFVNRGLIKLIEIGYAFSNSTVK